MRLSIHRPHIIIVGLLLLIALLAAVAMKTGVAHAASPMLLFPHLCADTPTVQNCNAIDPIDAGCLADARSVDTHLAIHNGAVVGYVVLRASASCHTTRTQGCPRHSYGGGIAHSSFGAGDGWIC